MNFEMRRTDGRVVWPLLQFIAKKVEELNGFTYCEIVINYVKEIVYDDKTLYTLRRCYDRRTGCKVKIFANGFKVF